MEPQPAPGQLFYIPDLPPAAAAAAAPARHAFLLPPAPPGGRGAEADPAGRGGNPSKLGGSWRQEPAWPAPSHRGRAAGGAAGTRPTPTGAPTGRGAPGASPGGRGARTTPLPVFASGRGCWRSPVPSRNRCRPGRAVGPRQDGQGSAGLGSPRPSPPRPGRRPPWRCYLRSGGRHGLRAPASCRRLLTCSSRRKVVEQCLLMLA